MVAITVEPSLDKPREWADHMSWRLRHYKKDDIEMTDDDKNTLDKNAFAKLLGVVRDSCNFETHKIAYI